MTNKCFKSIFTTLYPQLSKNPNLICKFYKMIGAFILSCFEYCSPVWCFVYDLKLGLFECVLITSEIWFICSCYMRFYIFFYQFHCIYPHFAKLIHIKQHAAQQNATFFLIKILINFLAFLAYSIDQFWK